MKKTIIIILLSIFGIGMLIASYSYNFNIEGLIVPANPITIFTPNGGMVSAWDTAEAMTTTKRNEKLADFNTYFSSDCVILGDATTTYNCHAYAWYMTEGGSDCWIDPVEVHKYIDDQSYVQTTSQYAEKIVYPNNYAHSAVNLGNGYYVSKWGIGFLVKHAPDRVPSSYYINGKTYYAKPPTISGHNIVSYNVSSTFSVSCPIWGTTLNWVYDTNLFDLVSSSGLNITLKAKSSTLKGTCALTANYKDSSNNIVYSCTYAIYANRLPGFGDMSLRVVRSSDGVEVYPSYVGLCPNNFYYAYLTGTSPDYSYTWDMNHATVYSSSYNQAYFKTDSEGWTFLDIYATDSATGVTQKIHGVTLYGGNSCN